MNLEKDRHDKVINGLTTNIQLKHNFYEEDWRYVKPLLLFILLDMASWCEVEGLPFKITRIIDGPIPLITKSTTHKDGRAFDLSQKHWGKDYIEKFDKHFNDKYATKYGTSPDGYNPKVVVSKEHGTGPHFHIQIRRGVEPKWRF